MKKSKGGLIKKMYVGEHKVEFYGILGEQIDVYINGKKEDEIQTCDSYDLTRYEIIDWYTQGMRKVMDKCI